MTARYPLVVSSWDCMEEFAMKKVISTGMFTAGAVTKDFEAAFAKYVGAKYAVFVNSGSSANLLMATALRFSDNGLRPGDEIIVPAVSWSTTYAPFVQLGMKLKFVDVDPRTFNYDILELKKAITPETRVVVVVNLLGNPNEFEAIHRILANTDVLLLEDNCESMGAMYAAKSAGTFGLMGTFSTFRSHHMNTMEGGLVVTDSETLYHKLLSLRAHGWTRDLPRVSHLHTKSDDDFYEMFNFVLPGYSVRPNEMQAAVGLEQLRKFDLNLRQRRANAKNFLDLICAYPGLSGQTETGRSSWFGFGIIVEPWCRVSRADILKVFRQHEIEYRPIVAGNFTRNPVMRWVDHAPLPELPGADKLHDRGFFLGNHHHEMDFEFAVLRRALDEVFRHA